MRSNEFLLESNSRGLAQEISQVLTDQFLSAGYQVKVTEHFVDQIYNNRNQDPIIMKEVAYVFSRLLRFQIDSLNEIPDQSAFSVQDRMTGIGMAFIKHAGEPNRIIATTIIRDVLKARGQPVITT
jgi:hypothetical protein